MINDTIIWIEAEKMPNQWEAIWEELARYFRHRDHPETHQTK
jgi:hypothetical protein